MGQNVRRSGVEAPLEVIAKQIELLGQRLVGQRVKISNCQFRNASIASVHQMRTSIARYQQEAIEDEPDGWINFWISDVKGNMFLECYASLANTGEFVTSLNVGSRLSVEGTVFRIYTPIGEKYGLMADRIITVGPMTELKW